MPKDATCIANLLAKAGFIGAEPQRKARATLEREGLTKPEKANIANYKLPRVEALLDKTFLRSCEHCMEITKARNDLVRDVVVVPPEGCEICKNSSNRRSVLALCPVMKQHGIYSIIIVGGYQSSIDEFKNLMREECSQVLVTCIEGNKQVSEQRINSISESHQLIIIWARTPLPHKLSNQFSAPQKTITVPTTGIEAVAKKIKEHLNKG